MLIDIQILIRRISHLLTLLCLTLTLGSNNGAWRN